MLYIASKNKQKSTFFPDFQGDRVTLTQCQGHFNMHGLKGRERDYRRPAFSDSNVIHV